MRRREFTTLLGGMIASWPLAVGAQQGRFPTIGYLSTLSPQNAAKYLAAFKDGLKTRGFVEGRNLKIEYRWSNGEYAELAASAAELVRHQVSLLAAFSPPAALAAKAATSTIPIVFSTGTDPVSDGLVTSLNRPGGNATGIHLLINSLEPKRLDIIREMLPRISKIAVLANPDFSNTVRQTAQIEKAAQILGMQTQIFRASTDADIKTAFSSIGSQQYPALIITTDPFFLTRSNELSALAPAAIADEAWHVASQPRSAWSFNVEIRPFGETW
jgi:putative tryptophan/tyrosine transport system substrate-binding protein